MTYVPKILSGIDVIDTTWGGLYQGGSYMCNGHASSGRGLLGMLFLRTGDALGEKGLLISPGRPQDWSIQASSVQFDFEAAQAAGTLRSIWIPAFVNTQQASDQGGRQVLDDLFHVIQREKPQRVLINDFVPFLQFHSFELFRQAFAAFMSRLEEVESTVMLMMPEALNTSSQQILDFMRNYMTGSVHISIDEENAVPDRRRLVLLPGGGHVERAVFDEWAVPVATPPKKGRRIPRSKKPVAVKAGSMAALSDREAMPLGTSVVSMPVESLKKVVVRHESFVSKLDILFKRRTNKGNDPFLLVALRVEADQDAFDAEVVLERLIPVIESIVVEPVDLLLDAERQRIIALLPDTGPDGVQAFFEMIQEKLSQDHPDMAEQLPHVVSAVVVPDGQPFENPQDFLAYALEGR